jgi:hypothetical protein
MGAGEQEADDAAGAVGPPAEPAAGYPGGPYPGSGYPGSAYPGSGYPGSGYPGLGYPGYGYPGYGYPGYGPPPRKTNGLAIASLVVGLGSLVVCPLFAVIGIVLGVVARRQIRERDEDGAGIALAGLIISSALTALAVFVVFAYAAFLAIIASSGGFSSSGSGSSRPRSATTSVTPTTERVTGTATTVPRSTGTTATPSGVFPLSACPRVTLALKNLTQPADADQAILSDAARTLHTELPAQYGDDVDTLLTDATSRMGRSNTGPPSSEVTAATQRVAAVINAACPS